MTSMWPSKQEAPHQSFCADTSLASATLWLLFEISLQCNPVCGGQVGEGEGGAGCQHQIMTAQSKAALAGHDKNYLWKELLGEAFIIDAIIQICDIWDQVLYVMNLQKKKKKNL